MKAVYLHDDHWALVDAALRSFRMGRSGKDWTNYEIIHLLNAHVSIVEQLTRAPGSLAESAQTPDLPHARGPNSGTVPANHSNKRAPLKHPNQLD